MKLLCLVSYRLYQNCFESRDKWPLINILHRFSPSQQSMERKPNLDVKHSIIVFKFMPEAIKYMDKYFYFHTFALFSIRMKWQ